MITRSEDQQNLDWTSGSVYGASNSGETPLVYVADTPAKVAHFNSAASKLRENRFAAQSVTHDYWATVFHLGEFILGIPDGVRFLSEQEMQCPHAQLVARHPNLEHIRLRRFRLMRPSHHKPSQMPPNRAPGGLPFA